MRVGQSCKEKPGQKAGGVISFREDGAIGLLLLSLVWGGFSSGGDPQ